MVSVTLTERQREVLYHVAQYRLTTIEAVDRLYYEVPAGRSNQTAALKLLARLVDAGLLRPPHRIRHRNFYQLSSLGARHLGASRRAGEELRYQALRERYTILSFCCLQPLLRVYLPPEEFERRYPQIAKQPGIDPAHQYYFHTRQGGEERLGQALIDVSADPSRALRKCIDTMFRVLQTPVFGDRPFLGENRDRFQLALLVAEESKALKVRQLVSALAEKDRPLPLRVVVVAQMNDLPFGEVVRTSGASS